MTYASWGARDVSRPCACRAALSAVLLIGFTSCGLERRMRGGGEPDAGAMAAAHELRPALDGGGGGVHHAGAATRADVSRPMSVDEAILLALENNPDVRAAAERISQAEARVGEATAAFFPQISGRVSFARTDNPMQAFGMILSQRRFSPGIDFNDPGTTQNVRPEIAGVVPLFRGGQDYQRRMAAKLGAEAVRLERMAVRNALADSVAAAYYALALAPEQVEAARASIQAVESALGQARLRVAAGAALRSDVLSLEVRLAAAREAHVRARNAVELARAGLRILLGLPYGAAVEVAANPSPRDGHGPVDIEKALADARSNRPELEAAALLAAIRDRELKMERAAYLPRVDAVANYGNDSEDFKLSSRRDSWAVGATAEMDLFSGFRTASRVRAAERRLAEAAETERKARLEIEREVTTALLQLQEAEERARVTEAAVASAEEALRLVQEQYHGGAVIVTRYLDAEAARTEARSHAIAARFDVRRAEAALKKAIGLWAHR